MTITAEDVQAARDSDEKMIAAEKAQQALIQSAEDTIAELTALARNIPVTLDPDSLSTSGDVPPEDPENHVSE